MHSDFEINQNDYRNKFQKVFESKTRILIEEYQIEDDASISLSHISKV